MTEQYKYGSYFQRLLARLSDTLLLTLPWAIGFNMLVARSADVQSITGNLLGFLVFVFSPTIFVAFVYSALMIHYFGTTIGKFVVGLKVLDAQGKNLFLKRAFFRQTFGYMLSNFIFGLGYLAIIRNKSKQGWHDEVVGSFVVSKNKLWYLGILFIIALMAIHAYFIGSSVGLLLKSFEGLFQLIRLFS